MTEFNSLDKLILERLLHSDELTVVEVHRANKFNPLDISDSIDRLSGVGLLDIVDGKFLKRGKAFESLVVKLRFSIFKRLPTWKQVHGKKRT